MMRSTNLLIPGADAIGHRSIPGIVPGISCQLPVVSDTFQNRFNWLALECRFEMSPDSVSS